MGISSLPFLSAQEYILWSEAMLCETVNNIFSDLTDDNVGRGLTGQQAEANRIQNKGLFQQDKLQSPVLQEGPSVTDLPPGSCMTS